MTRASRSLLALLLPALSLCGCSSFYLDPPADVFQDGALLEFDVPIARTLSTRNRLGTSAPQQVAGVSETFSQSSAQHQKMADQTSGAAAERHGQMAGLDRQTARSTAGLDVMTSTFGALAAAGEILRESEAGRVGSFLASDTGAVGAAAPEGSELRITVGTRNLTSTPRTFWNGFAIIFLLGIPPMKAENEFTVTAELVLPDGSSHVSTRKSTQVTYMGWLRGLIIPSDSPAVSGPEFQEQIPKFKGHTYPENLYILLGRQAIQDVAKRRT